MLSSSPALTRSLQIGLGFFFTSKSCLSYWGTNFDKPQLSCANYETSIFIEVHCKYNTKALQIPTDLGSASGRCWMSSFLCRLNKPLLSIKSYTGPLLSLSVIIFKTQYTRLQIYSRLCSVSYWQFIWLPDWPHHSWRHIIWLCAEAA